MVKLGFAGFDSPGRTPNGVCGVLGYSRRCSLHGSIRSNSMQLNRFEYHSGSRFGQSYFLLQPKSTSLPLKVIFDNQFESVIQ